MSDDPQEMVKTILKAQIVRAFNDAPDTIEKLVHAALSKPVDDSGKSDGYASNKKPYIDYLVGRAIRDAAEAAVYIVVQEQKERITDYVRKGLSAESLVDAVTKTMIDAANDSWRIKVTFEKDKDR